MKILTPREALEHSAESLSRADAKWVEDMTDEANNRLSTRYLRPGAKVSFLVFTEPSRRGWPVFEQRCTEAGWDVWANDVEVFFRDKALGPRPWYSFLFSS